MTSRALLLLGVFAGFSPMRSEPVPAATAAAPAVETTATAADTAAILALRRGRLVIEGAPGADVSVQQVRHAFWFGAALANQAFNGAMDPGDRDRYREAFLANFNAGVTENALKWLSMEARRGEIHYETVDAILDWTAAHDIPLRGHNVFWGVTEWQIPWQKDLDPLTLRTVLRDRALDVSTRYRGRFAEYDLNNEMVHSNVYADRLGAGITAEMAAWMKQGDPACRLFLNDYDILTGRKLEAYAQQIRDLLAQGVPIAGIGVQGHLHGVSFDRAELRHALDVLGQFHLPIRVTEFNLPGQRSPFLADPQLALTPDQAATQARDIADYYRICFAHPAVEGILMWGFWAGANWIPASSLYQRDWTPTPALAAYRDLVFGEWWTRWSGHLDANGRAEIPAFYGRYDVTIGGRVQTVDLSKQAGSLTVMAQ